MAIRRAVTTGNWSDSATWDTVTWWVPTAWDIVYADWYTVTLDQDITVASINTTQRTGGTTWWKFEFTTNRTVNANVNAWTSTCLSSWATAYNLTATVNWNIVWWSVSWAYWLWLATANYWTSRAVVTGNVTAGFAPAIYGDTIQSIRHLDCIVVGNVVSASWVNAITCHSAWDISLLTVTWDMTSISSFCAVNVTDFILVGNAYASSVWVVLAKSSTSTATISWSLENSWWVMALADFRIVHFSPTLWTARKFQDTNNADKRLYTEWYFECPAEADVREWTVYWLNTWTLAVPDPSNVASGVPTDDTVWTADFDLVGIRDRLWVINDWIKKASLLIPHTEDLPED